MTGRLVFLTLVMAAGLLAVLGLCERRFFLFDALPTQTSFYKNYRIEPQAVLPPARPGLPPMPDLSGFTVEAVQAMMPPIAPGTVALKKIVKGDPGLDKFAELRRQQEFSRLQKRAAPVVIALESGVFDLAALHSALSDEKIMSLRDGVYTLRLPVYIAAGAALNIAGTPEAPARLRLAQESGAFVVNAGRLFIIDATVEGWNETAGAASVFEKDDMFRPFITGWSASETYMARARIADLGYAASKSYGITYSSSTSMLKRDPDTPRPRGWIIACVFERLYYGFYSYEADDIVILRNIYKNNIVYGIDPHDRSRRLVIAENEAYGTQKKHGIIVSREVNDSWIVNNRTHHNAGSGIMLDRTSVRNLVAGNFSYLNASDGITLFESQNNEIRDNVTVFNGKHGLRLRNSWDVIAARNTIAFNKEIGVQVYTQNLEAAGEERDLAEDPYSMRAGIDMRRSGVYFNRRGEFKFNDTESVTLSGINFAYYNKYFVRGDMDDIGRDIARALARGAGTVRITKTQERTVAGP